ncbi:sensor histidine kinase [Pseudonocardia xinjiangensis]|uniref:histidine kinase n=1 Tax=Pseudonocardia xinjiangensis TaxID=75289 RepID=A0ABX1RNU3_9PSEU|nr:GAF domain-containing protein [Pseudonocardia xinjiangensis]NMH80861.1 GAF domain-containing protein [Pseudonocardia xinjiangensis]
MADAQFRPRMFSWLSGLLTGAVLVAAVSGLIALLAEHVPVLSLLVLYLLAVLPIALLWGSALAAVVAVASVAAFIFLFLNPVQVRMTEQQTLFPLAVFLLTAVAVGQLGARSQQQARESARLSDEQAALRRVATLVAHSTPALEVFEAVTREVGLLCGADLARLERYEEDGSVTGVAAWSRVPVRLAVGTRFALEGLSVAAQVRLTGGPVRVDGFEGASGPIAEEALDLKIRWSVGCPIVVAGHLWGVIAASSRNDVPFPVNTEAQLADFTELVATTIENAQGRAEISQLLENQAALRRLATLVARNTPAAEVVSAVASEVGSVIGATATVIVRLDADGLFTVAARAGERRDLMGAGSRWTIEPPHVVATAVATGRPALFEGYGRLSGRLADELRQLDIHAALAIPIMVGERTWGALCIASRDIRFPTGTEQRMEAFTELVSIAIADAESAAELAASRARIVTASDEARRQIERDLHDGAQQRLVTLGLELSILQSSLHPSLGEVRSGIVRISEELSEVIDELREMSRGIHPAILSEGGLSPALRALARRSTIPVELDVRTQARFREPVEVAAYYVVSEALTNMTKYADASYATVVMEERYGTMRLSVQDDGVGGADPARGSGLVGIRDRVEALGGSFEVNSPIEEGTLIQVCLPIQPE